MPDRMTISQARTTFAALMATARRRKLTSTEKSELSYARQALRTDRKETRRNPRKPVRGYYVVTWGPGKWDHKVFQTQRGAETFRRRHYPEATISVSGPGVPTSKDVHGIVKSNPGRFSVYTFEPGRGHEFRTAVSTLAKAKTVLRQYTHGGFVAGPGGKVVHTVKRPAPSTPLRRNKPKANPSGLVRMGKLVEIRYYRDHGRAKGFYKHPFKVRPEIFYRPSDNSILIKGGKS